MCLGQTTLILLRSYSLNIRYFFSQRKHDRHSELNIPYFKFFTFFISNLNWQLTQFCFQVFCFWEWMDTTWKWY